MKNYIEHIKNTRTPHERRTHALQIAGVLTAAVFVVWLGTLSLRLGLNNDTVAAEESNQTTLPGQSSLSASAAAATQNNQAHLEVSTTSVGN